MKRTMTSFIIITVFVFSVITADLWFMSRYADGMNKRLDRIDEVSSFEEKRTEAKALDEYFKRCDFWAHRLIPTGRLEEIETLLYKLNSYLVTADEHEVDATVAELKARVNLLYSTMIYHWYHLSDSRIE